MEKASLAFHNSHVIRIFNYGKFIPSTFSTNRARSSRQYQLKTSRKVKQVSDPFHYLAPILFYVRIIFGLDNVFIGLN